MIAADEVDKWSQLCEGLKNEWECTTVNLDVFEKFHTIAVYDAVLMLVRNDNGKLGRLIWEVRQYSRAPIIVVIPGIQAVKKYIEWGADTICPESGWRSCKCCSCGGKTWWTYRFYREGRKGYAWRVFEICAGKRKRGNGRNASG